VEDAGRLRRQGKAATGEEKLVIKQDRGVGERKDLVAPPLGASSAPKALWASKQRSAL
jgi:hypothetical protein